MLASKFSSPKFVQVTSCKKCSSRNLFGNNAWKRVKNTCPHIDFLYCREHTAAILAFLLENSNVSENLLVHETTWDQQLWAHHKARQCTSTRSLSPILFPPSPIVPTKCRRISAKSLLSPQEEKPSTLSCKNSLTLWNKGAAHATTAQRSDHFASKQNKPSIVLYVSFGVLGHVFVPVCQCGRVYSGACFTIRWFFHQTYLRLTLWPRQGHNQLEWCKHLLAPAPGGWSREKHVPLTTVLGAGKKDVPLSIYIWIGYLLTIHDAISDHHTHISISVESIK